VQPPTGYGFPDRPSKRVLAGQGLKSERGDRKSKLQARGSSPAPLLRLPQVGVVKWKGWQSESVTREPERRRHHTHRQRECLPFPAPAQDFTGEHLGYCAGWQTKRSLERHISPLTALPTVRPFRTACRVRSTKRHRLEAKPSHILALSFPLIWVSISDPSHASSNLVYLNTGSPPRFPFKC
jgi:hypothetical protein